LIRQNGEMNRKRPNLLLITTDQHRWDAMGCAGNLVIRTPHLDWLAAGGTLFSQAVTPCPICIPARFRLDYSWFWSDLVFFFRTVACRNPKRTRARYC
jgi:hypothetical protein